MVKRITVANRNIMAKFIELANMNDWTVDIAHTTLVKDKLFPVPNNVVHEQSICWYFVDKNNGKWDLMKLDGQDCTQSVIVGGLSTRAFECVLESSIKILQEIKKGSYTK